MWHYELIPAAGRRVGEEPFRARGLAYVGALRYVDGRIPGGREAFRSALPRMNPWDASFYDQIFLVTGDYDISPLLALFVVAAKLEGTPIARFIEAGARWSGSSDSKGIWKPALKGTTPEEVASRLHFAFQRYYPPCQAEATASRPGHFTGELSKVPVCMDGIYVASTTGFYRGAMEDVGAKNVRVDWAQPVLEGAEGGVAVERLRFDVRWG